MAHLAERNSDFYPFRYQGRDFTLNRFHIPTLDGGIIELLFSELEMQDRRFVLSEGVLPERLIFRKLEEVGVPLVYCVRVDVALWGVCAPAILSYVEDMCSGASNGFLLLGPVGTGKTMALRYAVERLLTHSNGRVKPSQISFITHSRLAQMVYDRKHSRESLLHIADVPYLFFDDLGRAYTHEYPISELDNLISHRQEALLTTCITTNLEPAKIEELGDYARIYSRLKHPSWMHTPLTLSGKDLRGQR